jgi:hypothetical protein
MRMQPELSRLHCSSKLLEQTPRTPTKAMRASLARHFEVSSPNPLRQLVKLSTADWCSVRGGGHSRPDLTRATLPGCSASVAIEEVMGETSPITYFDRRRPLQ